MGRDTSSAGSQPADRLSLPGAHVMAHDYGDEVVVANLTTGWFYSLTGSSRSVWCALAAGWSVGEVIDACQWEDAPNVVEEVVALAVEADLLVVTTATAPPGSLADIACEPGGIESFDDLQDALMLDPVHEVADEGWPHAAQPG